MESMTMSPYLMPNARQGYRMGSGEVIDHMFYDGLQNPYDQNLMGYFAEQTSKKYGFTREDQDLFSIESVNRSLRAQKSGLFDDEIESVVVKTRRDTSTISKDEEPEKDRGQREGLYPQARHQAGRLEIGAIPSFTSSFSCPRASSPCPASSPSPW